MKRKLSIIILLLCFALQSKGQTIANLNATQLNVSGVDQIELTWQSADEYMWCHFVIERDINNQGNFTSYDTLNAIGNTTGATNYLFTDFGVQNGITYCYRLKLIVDNPPIYCDSLAFYSDTVCVIFTLSIGEYISPSFYLYPNPFSSQTVLHSDNLLHNATLTVDNCFGQTVKEINNISGQTIILHRDNLPSGLYFIRLTEDNKQIETKKIIITD